ncbi:hypothetical protein SBDP1_650018 [Syntrophobacter sp. SbD1]|nr:hypothetical protein SBDP1_650018 [Syntrophobacter sp. SbD1]
MIGYAIKLISKVFNAACSRSSQNTFERQAAVRSINFVRRRNFNDAYVALTLFDLLGYEEDNRNSNSFSSYFYYIIRTINIRNVSAFC